METAPYDSNFSENYTSELNMAQTRTTGEFRTMYVLLNKQDYHALNASISEALGYCEGKGTVYYTNPEPETVGGYAVMIITAEVQRVCLELLNGLELLDSSPKLTSDIHIEHINI